MRTDPLIAAYPVRIRTVILLVLCILSALMWAFPRFLEEPQKGRIHFPDPPVDTLLYIPPPTDAPEPEAPTRPSVPVASDDEFLDVDLTIEDTDFDSFDVWDQLPEEKDVQKKFVFIHYDKRPEPITAIRPEYPEIAKEAGIEGLVIVDFFVDKKGNVSDIYIFQGIPNTGLNEAAMDAIKHTKWKPALQRDRKVGVWMRFPINFTLERN